MAPVNRNEVSLYEEAKAGLGSLIQQIVTVFTGFIIVLLITGGTPPSFVIALSFCLGTAFVAWNEQRRIKRLRETSSTDTLATPSEVKNIYYGAANRTKTEVAEETGVIVESRIDLRLLYQAMNPTQPLVITEPQDQKYYINFSSVRGGDVVEELKQTITYSSPDNPTHQLLTGHRGCGKSTELLRLKIELEKDNFHVVYFEVNHHLEMMDIDVIEVLLTIALQTYSSLEEIGLSLKLENITNLFSELRKFLKIPVELFAMQSLSSNIESFIKEGLILREEFRQSLTPQRLIDAIKKDVMEPGIRKLKRYGKKGLVVIVDGFEKINDEHLFIDQGQFLSGLSCHTIYTMPLLLELSNNYERLIQQFGKPKVLPLIPVRYRDGGNIEEGIALLRQMVLARVYPDLSPKQRLEKVAEVFDSSETLNYLCIISGGHLHNLLFLLRDWIVQQQQFPLSCEILEKVSHSRRNDMTILLSPHEWELLGQVKLHKKVSSDEGYQMLIRNQLVFEYGDRDESWFNINPILEKEI